MYSALQRHTREIDFLAIFGLLLLIAVQSFWAAGEYPDRPPGLPVGTRRHLPSPRNKLRNKTILFLARSCLSSKDDASTAEHNVLIPPAEPPMRPFVRSVHPAHLATRWF